MTGMPLGNMPSRLSWKDCVRTACLVSLRVVNAHLVVWDALPFSKRTNFLQALLAKGLQALNKQRVGFRIKLALLEDGSRVVVDGHGGFGQEFGE